MFESLMKIIYKNFNNFENTFSLGNIKRIDT